MTPTPPIRKRHPTTPDATKPSAQPRAEAPRRIVSRQPVHVRLRRVPPARTIAGMVVIVVGLALFVAGNLGARTGAITIPGDPHHGLSQILGFAIMLGGLGLATSHSRARR